MSDPKISELVKESHETAKEKGWWDDDVSHNVGEKLMLMVTEVAEAMEEYRTGRPLEDIYYRESDGKPEGFTVEIADVMIRIADLIGRYDLPIERALDEKLAFNKLRPFRHGGKIA